MSDEDRPMILVPCSRCERRFDDLVGQVIGKGVGKVPGHTVGSNWDWVPCPACGGTREVEAGESATAALYMLAAAVLAVGLWVALFVAGRLLGGW